MSDSVWEDLPNPTEDGDWVDIEPQEKNHPIVSGVRNFAQGASGNFSDEIAGAFEAGGQAIGLKGLGGPMKDIGMSDDGPTIDWEVLRDAYRRGRNLERGSLKQDAIDNPGVSATANIAGSIASPINKLAAPLSAARGGAVLGGINALGSSESEDVLGMASDTAMGAGLGYGIGKVVDGATPYIQAGARKAGDAADWVGQKFAGGAENLMARALGAERGTIKKLGMDRVKGAARQALDEGMASPLASTDDLISRNNSLLNKGGGMMDEAYTAIDDAGASNFNPLEVASAVDDKIGGFYRSPINRGETNQLENTLESILMRGDKSIPIKEAQSLKEELGKVANWKNTLNITDKEKMARDAYGVVSKHIDDAVAGGSQAIEKAGLTDVLSRGKKLYSNAKVAEELLENKSAREQGNKFFGLTDTITGAGALGYGGMTNDWETAGGVMLAKKGLEKYGAQNAAMLFDKISKSLMKSPQMAQLSRSNPKAFHALVSQMGSKMGASEGSVFPKAANESPDQTMNFNDTHNKDALIQKAQGTKYQQVLQNAAQNGDQSFSAAHYVLHSRDPEYRKTIGQGE